MKDSVCPVLLGPFFSHDVKSNHNFPDSSKFANQICSCWWKENFRVSRESYHYICTLLVQLFSDRISMILRTATAVETSAAIGL